MYRNIFIAILILINIQLVSAININEIMYNPIGDDDKHEWIEIYNNGLEPIDLSNWKLYEAGINHNLNIKQGNLILNPNEYAIITQDDVTFLQDYPTYSKTILDSSFSLSNSEETIAIKNQDEEIVDEVIYSEIWGASNNGKSLEFYEGKWYESLQINGTPGYKNSISNIGQDFSKLKINEFLPDPFGYDNAPMPQGEFIELYNPNNLAIDLKGLKFKDNANHELIISDINTISGTIIQPKSYLAVYMNGFSGLLNNDGLEIIKLYNLNNSLIDEISYSFSEEGLSWSKVNNIWQLRMPSPNEENKLEEPIYKSNLEIENIYIGSDEKAKFGDNLRVRVNIYKGNTSKETLKLYATTENEEEQISKQTQTNLMNKFTNYTLTLPIQIEPNCKQKYPAGTYKIILEGLNEKTSKEIKIEGLTSSLCQKVKENITKEIHYELISMPGNLKLGDPIVSEIKIINDEKLKTEYEAWSFIQKGTRIITGEEKDNLQKINLPAGSSAIITLENNLEEDIESGEYTIKIKLLKENRVRPIVIDSKINIKTDEIKSENKIQEFPLGTGETVYLSSNQKAKNLSLYLFISLLLLITIVIILKK